MKKACPECNQYKELTPTNWHLNKYYGDGFARICKVCKKKYDDRYTKDSHDLRKLKRESLLIETRKKRNDSFARCKNKEYVENKKIQKKERFKLAVNEYKNNINSANEIGDKDCKDYLYRNRIDVNDDSVEFARQVIFA